MTDKPDQDNALVKILEETCKQLPPGTFDMLIQEALGAGKPTIALPDPAEFFYVAAGAKFEKFDEFVCAYMLHVLHGESLKLGQWVDGQNGWNEDGERKRITVLYHIGGVVNFDPTHAGMAISISDSPGPAPFSLPYLDMRSDFYRTDKTQSHTSRHVVRQADKSLTAFHSLPTLLQQAIFYVQNGIWVTTCSGGSLATAVLEGYATDQRKSSLRSLLMILDGAPEFASQEAARFYELCHNCERTFEAFDFLLTNIEDFM